MPADIFPVKHIAERNFLQRRVSLALRRNKIITACDNI